MREMSPPELNDLVTIDGDDLRIQATVSMLDETCERYAHTRLASLQDQLLLARHCHDANPAVVERLRREASAIREGLDSSVRVVDACIDARTPGLPRASQRVAAASARRASTTVLSVFRALLDSEAVVRSGPARDQIRVADGSATTARRVDTVLSEIDRAVSDHRAIVTWLQHEQSETAIRAAHRLHRRATATATIDALTLRAQARQHVA